MHSPKESKLISYRFPSVFNNPFQTENMDKRKCPIMGCPRRNLRDSKRKLRHLGKFIPNVKGQYQAVFRIRMDPGFFPLIRSRTYPDPDLWPIGSRLRKKVRYGSRKKFHPDPEINLDPKHWYQEISPQFYWAKVTHQEFWLTYWSKWIGMTFKVTVSQDFLAIFISWIIPIWGPDKRAKIVFLKKFVFAKIFEFFWQTSL